MDIIISNSSGKPIYEQIAEQIRTMILDGRLKEGDALPSMRALAKDLQVSLITTKRSYEELEQSGLIESFTGRGSFVASIHPELMKERMLTQIEDHLNQAVELARAAGITCTELHDLLDLCYDTTEGSHS